MNHPSTLEWLECTSCRGARLSVTATGRCECGGVLLARYRLDEAARSLTHDRLKEREATLWRYVEVLPPARAKLTLGEGMTPLLQTGFLAASLGLAHVYVKDEAINPTGSVEARGMATAVMMARERGTRRIALASTGHDASAAAAYGAAAGLAVELFTPFDTPEPFRIESDVLGAVEHRIEGDLRDCRAHLRELTEDERGADLSAFEEPYRIEGLKTLGYEIAEQMGWDVPEVIVDAMGEGSALVGMAKAFEEMGQMGLLSSRRRPRWVAVQAAGCAPIVRAFDQGKTRVEPWAEPRTLAASLRVAFPVAGALLLQILRESAGVAVAVSDAEMAQGQIDLARGEGIYAGPEGGACLAAARRLAAEGWIETSDRVVLVNAATGLKTAGISVRHLP